MMQTFKHFRLFALLIALALLLVGCGDTASQQEGEVVVFAASSLQDAFKPMQGNIGNKVTYNFGGSQALVTQLTQGAKADVFASADAKNMDVAITAGVVETGTQKVLATNKLVVVIPSGSAKVASLSDLAKPGVKLALADKSVPVGNYALQSLDKLSADPAYGGDFKGKVLGNAVSYETNVRQVLSKVQLGEADAGIVYATDAQSAKDKVQVIEIPASANVLARYYIAPLKGAAHPQEAKRFIEYALSTSGQDVLGSFGFGPAEEGK